MIRCPSTGEFGLYGVSPAFFKDIQAAGLDLHVWTVDDAHHAAILGACGVDEIKTNRPGWLRQ